MSRIAEKRTSRKARHARIRRKVAGTSSRPRLCVFRSANHIYAQLIDDTQGETLISISTLNGDLKTNTGSKIDRARQLGQALGKKALENGITQVVFDRAGYKFHGRVKSLAEAAREAGLRF